MERGASGGCALAAAAVGALTALLPAGDVQAHSARGRTVTIVVGKPGDHWADTLRYTYIGQGKRGDEYGYEVRLEAADGCRVTLFYARRGVDLRGDAPGFRLHKIRVPTGWPWYPTRLTAKSLPKVYPGVMELEGCYTRQAEGAIAAAQGFANVAAVGGLAPVSRVVAPALRSGAARAAPRSGAARAAPAPAPAPRATRYLPVGPGAATRGSVFKHAWIRRDLYQNLQRLVGMADFNKFKAALKKGVVGPTGESGIEILREPVRGFTHELKIGGSAQRLLRRINEHGALIFEEFVRGGLH